MRVIPHVQWCSQKWKAVVENLFKKYFELKVIYYIIVFFFSLNCDFYCKKKKQFIQLYLLFHLFLIT